MKNKNTILLTMAITVLVVALVSATFAYFAAQGDVQKSKNVNVTSSTTDLLTFAIDNDINMRITQADFAPGAGNKSATATGTATLRPNNNTGSAAMHYYVYLDFYGNPFEDEEIKEFLRNIPIKYFDKNIFEDLANESCQNCTKA